MRTSDFDYALPKELIAQTPLEPRDASRLLVLDRGAGSISHLRFRDLPAHLRPGDVLVCNDSRVIPARVHGRKIPTGGRVELLLLNRRERDVWEALVRPMARLRPGTRVLLGAGRDDGDDLYRQPPPGAPVAEMIGRAPSGAGIFRFSAPVEGLLDQLGCVPLPPYIHQPLSDAERYQTIFSRVLGSVAAPTAGLHFTPDLVRAIEAAGASFAFVTLHVGWDTFRPVQEARIEDHVMHSEFARVDAHTVKNLNRKRREDGRIIAVGTTTVRALETAAQGGGEGVPLAPFSGPTDLFIHPGYRFRAVDALITNFHLPRSTLLMLVSAFAGADRIRRAYEDAVRERYRFFSFGDAMLIL